MPSIDLSRSRFRLTDEHLVVLSELAAGRPVDQEFATARKEVEDSGLVTADGRLVQALLPLVQTFLTPGVVISLEAGSRQGTLRHGMFIGDEHVVAHEAWPGEAEEEYSLVEPKTLVFKLASMVNLRQSPAARQTALTAVETTVSGVEGALAALKSVAGPGRTAEEEQAAVRQALATGGTLAEPALSLLAELVSELRCSWRMTAAWQGRQGGQEGVEGRGFAVWDCGPLGYWLRELPQEPLPAEQVTPSSPFRLVRTDARSIWTLITDLLPDAEEIRAARAGR
ncbi:histidine kinase [Streptomyces fradiae]|uniref:histidine kinase n=1 Tax=Streptomyces fradiae TaxID=1906 RepID=UPI002942CCA9|nr:histidine kinase [Streptomyces fradiae]WOI59079.1 histidine kinase [Streptomyces fradiae]